MRGKNNTSLNYPGKLETGGTTRASSKARYCDFPNGTQLRVTGVTRRSTAWSQHLPKVSPQEHWATWNEALTLSFSFHPNFDLPCESTLPVIGEKHLRVLKGTHRGSLRALPPAERDLRGGALFYLASHTSWLLAQAWAQDRKSVV